MRTPYRTAKREKQKKRKRKTKNVLNALRENFLIFISIDILREREKESRTYKQFLYIEEFDDYLFLIIMNRSAILSN